MAGLLLGIDVGTYSSKGVLVAPDGEVRKTAVVDHDLEVPRPGWAEHDADGVWWHDLVALCRQLLDGHPYSGDDVAGIAVSAIGPCLLPVARDGRPLRKGILYGIDVRASDEIAALNERWGTDSMFALAGMHLSSQAVGPKIVWLRRHEPEVWREAAWFTTASSYLVFRLTGERVIDRHTASYWMPLYELATHEWSDRFADGIVEIERLPRLGWSDELAGVVTAAAAATTGLTAGTPVTVGAVDALAEALSVGVVAPGDLMIMYGSTTFFILVLEDPIPNPVTWTTAGAFAGQHALAAGMATTGALTRWFRDQLARDLPDDQAYDALFAAAAEVAAGADGLLVLPYFSGERTPINDPHARGVVAGLDLHHTRDHLFRALLEGVGFGVRHNLESFESIGAQVERVVAVGGGTRGDTWLQIVSDISGKRQLVPRITIGASYGDAFLAGLATKAAAREDLASWVGAPRKIVPSAASKPQYDAAYARYLQLYRATKGVVHGLAGAEGGDDGG
jgi:xylulokinase